MPTPRPWLRLRIVKESDPGTAGECLHSPLFPARHSCQERDEAQAGSARGLFILKSPAVLSLFHIWSISGIQQGTMGREEDARQRQLLM